MLGNLYLLKNFNNYFNRKVIKYSNLSDYLGTGNYFLVSNTNFNPNDGISTSHVIGSAGTPFNKDWNPDYCLYVEEGNIISRWFVMKSNRTRDNQYIIALKRDTVADYLDNVLNAPSFIEKGHLKDTDPMIVNSEGMKFNQIKQKEYFLKDETKCPWVVAYVNQYNREPKTVTAKHSSAKYIEYADEPVLQQLFPNLNNPTKEYNVLVGAPSLDFNINFDEVAIPILYYRTSTVHLTVATYAKTKTWDADARGHLFYNSKTPVGYTDNGWDSGNLYHFQNIARDMVNYFQGDKRGRYLYAFYNALGCDTYEEDFHEPDYKKYMGATIHAVVGGVDKYFKFTRNQDKISEEHVTRNSYIQLLQNAFDNVTHTDWTKSSTQTGDFLVYGDAIKFVYRYSLSPAVQANIHADIPGTQNNTGFQTQYVPYDVLCFPAFNLTVTNTSGNDWQTDGLSGINIARCLKDQLGANVLLDVQLLPFCPCRELINKTTNKIDLRQAGEGQIVWIKDNANDTIAFGCFSMIPYSTLDITKLGVDIWSNDEVNVSDVLKITDRKIQSQTEMCRLCSPNFASMFEFNVAKTVDLGKTSISKFKVDYDLRPYNPYVHIAPDFGFLFKTDFNDSRGLIFSGDYGLTTMSNAWTEYQLNNKNYQNIFDRQIKNMDIMRDIDREKENWMIAGGMIGGAGIGAMGGAKAGPWGALIGGLSGFGLGAFASTRDKQLNEQTFQENRQMAIDIFNYQLDNIKAMPNTITHSATLTNNFKIFPLLEMYDCTVEEKTALEYQIYSRGMSIGRIGYIKDFLQSGTETYVSAKIIRMMGINNDNNIAMDIHNEVNQGLFIKGA